MWKDLCCCEREEDERGVCWIIRIAEIHADSYSGDALADKRIIDIGIKGDKYDSLFQLTPRQEEAERKASAGWQWSKS